MIIQIYKQVQKSNNCLRYKAPQMVLDAKLKPFIPDQVIAIGEVDAHIKMPRPDGQPETLGLITLLIYLYNFKDEPALNQSKKAKLDLLMREYVKVANRGKNTTIHAIENADKNPKEITAWINDMAEIHKKKQPPSVSYSKIMPVIEELMQFWPQEIEDLFQSTQLPGDNIDVGLQEYCQFSCNLLDIPVHPINNNRNKIESLHVLFTLFLNFQYQNIIFILIFLFRFNQLENIYYHYQQRKTIYFKFQLILKLFAI